jgi:hypothetical protein
VFQLEDVAAHCVSLSKLIDLPIALKQLLKATVCR